MRAISGVLSHSGLPNSEARVAFSRYSVSRRGEHARRQSGYSVFIHKIGKCIRRVEYVLGKLRRQRGEFVLDRRVAGLQFRGQPGAAEPEIAQRVVDHLAARRGERGEIRSGLERAVFLEQAQVLAPFGPELRYLFPASLISLPPPAPPSGATNRPQVGGTASREISAITARASPSRRSIAGAMCSGFSSAKR